MEQERYRGYVLWRHAIVKQDELLAPERYAASGTITRDNRLVETSGVVGVLDTGQEALDAGLLWAQACSMTYGTNFPPIRKRGALAPRVEGEIFARLFPAAAFFEKALSFRRRKQSCHFGILVVLGFCAPN